MLIFVNSFYARPETSIKMDCTIVINIIPYPPYLKRQATYSLVGSLVKSLWMQFLNKWCSKEERFYFFVFPNSLAPPSKVKSTIFFLLKIKKKRKGKSLEELELFASVIELLIKVLNKYKKKIYTDILISSFSVINCK